MNFSIFSPKDSFEKSNILKNNRRKLFFIKQTTTTTKLINDRSTTIRSSNSKIYNLRYSVKRIAPFHSRITDQSCQSSLPFCGYALTNQLPSPPCLISRLLQEGRFISSSTRGRVNKTHLDIEIFPDKYCILLRILYGGIINFILFFSRFVLKNYPPPLRGLSQGEMQRVAF